MNEKSETQSETAGESAPPDAKPELVSAFTKARAILGRLWFLQFGATIRISLAMAMFVMVVVVWNGKLVGVDRLPIALVMLSICVGALFLAMALMLDTVVIQRLHWVINTVQWHTQYLDKLNGLNKSFNAAEPVQQTVTIWPWGEHHTEMLGHLDAAASKWWAFYDPTQPDTAPTNEMVSTWLSEERNVSKDKARAIASILRADGLRTGPRR